MTSRTATDPASAAARTGSGISNCGEAFDSPTNNRPESILQAPHAATVIAAADRFRRRHAAYSVRIEARSEHGSHGRSRDFDLSEPDLEELIAAAERLENRGRP